MNPLLVAAATLSLLSLNARADPYELSFSALVTYSLEINGLPSPGQLVTGRITFDYDPAAYEVTLCGDGCASYAFSAPYQVAVNLGASTVTTPYSFITVEDNSLFADPASGPRDLVALGTKVPGFPLLSYILYLDAPLTSFAGAGIPSPSSLSSFWERGSFKVTANSLDTQLSADLVTLQVSAVPELTSSSLLAVGLLTLGLRGLRRREA